MAGLVYIINGPNLNLLGSREVEVYGNNSLEEINKNCLDLAKNLKLKLSFFQSNNEGDIINIIQSAIKNNIDFIIINAGAFSHTSIAILDALKSYKGRIIEVHLSNPYKRENFRNNSYISLVADGIICGLQKNVYLLALQALVGFDT